MKRLIHASPTRQRGNAGWTCERTGARPRFRTLDRRLAPNGTYFTLPLGGSDAVAAGEGSAKSTSNRYSPSPLVPRDPPEGRVISEVRAIRLAPCRSRRNDERGGFTLLEVVLTLAIFVGAMAVLSQLVSTGHRATISSRLQTQAIIRAEAQMNEVVANPSLMVSAAGMPFESEYNLNAPGQWQWSLDVQSWTQNSNLLQLELTVTHYSEDGIPNANYTLRRYVRDPQVLLESETAEEEALF